jgi:type I restriction enzyme S subunit
VKWPTPQLQEFCRIIQGGRSGLSGNDFVPEGVPAYGAGGLNGYLPTHEFDEPAVILSSIGARCGKCFYAEGKWASLANTQLIFPDSTKADVRFLWIQLNDESRWHRSGTGQPFIKPSDVKTHRVLLPSLAEQRRIAEVLDWAESLRVKRRAALTQLDSLTQSLFLDLFGDPATNPKGWPVRRFGELIIDGPQNGLYKPSTDYGSGTPILRIDAFYDGVVTDISALKRVRLTEAEVSSFQLSENDVVINRVNSLEYLGKCALIPELPEQTVFESNMMRMRFDPKIAHPRFVVQFLQTGFAKSQIQMRAKHAVNQASINQQDVSGFRVSLPAIELQQEFARRVRAVEKLKTAQRASLAELDALFASLQHRAFRGEI